MKNLLMKKMDGKRSRNESNIYINIFLGGILIYGEQKKQELIKVKVKIRSSVYVSYVQLSNKTELTKFKILREM